MNSIDSKPINQARMTEASSLARHIQHTLISNVLTETLWKRHIDECAKYQFHAAMIPGAWVKKTKEALDGTGVRVASFIDFPYGTMTSAGKTCEARNLVAEGAQEIDLMPNLGFLLSGMEKEYFDDIRGVVTAAENVPVKIMLELPLLSPEQRERAIALSVEAGVKYLKNASGGAVGIATPDEIRFLRRVAPRQVGVKASGGIKTAQQVRALIEAGADLVGTSSGAHIMQELLSQSTAAPRAHDTY
ncbi:MAG: deoxyribose-phosphate aldolase [Candidatus Sulfotelmatobacter sp.]